jgi:hypothetical protein
MTHRSGQADIAIPKGLRDLVAEALTDFEDSGTFSGEAGERLAKRVLRYALENHIVEPVKVAG